MIAAELSECQYLAQWGTKKIKGFRNLCVLYDGLQATNEVNIIFTEISDHYSHSMSPTPNV